MSHSAPNIIPTVGIHHGVASEVYHSWQALSHSWLNRLRQTPAHLLDLMENGGDESTPDMLFGSAVHCVVLEPDEYPMRYAAREEGVSGATKAGKEFKAKYESMGMSTLPFETGRWVEAVARRAVAHKRLQEWLHRDHAVEVSMVWEREGYLCKARDDLMVSGINILADLKTTTAGSEKGFAAQVAKYNYGGQAAWYIDGAQRLTGQAWDWQFVVCEKKRPFLVNCQAVPRDSELFLRSTTENDDLFALYKRCCSTRQWPGYQDVPEIKTPQWAIDAGGGDEETSFED